jgi:hypothetical protein
MLEAFKEMILEEKEASFEDANLAIYHHIINEKIQDAKDITLQEIKKYNLEDPESDKNGIDILYGYL